jgi:hypothetical protein
VKTQFPSKFDMKDLGASNFILGMEIKRDRKNPPGGAAQLASAMKMKFHEVSSSTPPDLPCVPRKGHRGHTWRL